MAQLNQRRIGLVLAVTLVCLAYCLAVQLAEGKMKPVCKKFHGKCVTFPAERKSHRTAPDADEALADDADSDSDSGKKDDDDDKDADGDGKPDKKFNNFLRGLKKVDSAKADKYIVSIEKLSEELKKTEKGQEYIKKYKLPSDNPVKALIARKQEDMTSNQECNTDTCKCPEEKQVDCSSIEVSCNNPDWLTKTCAEQPECPKDCKFKKLPARDSKTRKRNNKNPVCNKECMKSFGEALGSMKSELISHMVDALKDLDELNNVKVQRTEEEGSSKKNATEEVSKALAPPPVAISLSCMCPSDKCQAKKRKEETCTIICPNLSSCESFQCECPLNNN